MRTAVGELPADVAAASQSGVWQGACRNSSMPCSLGRIREHTPGARLLATGQAQCRWGGACQTYAAFLECMDGHERQQCETIAAAAVWAVTQCHRPSPPAVTNLAQGLVFGTIGFLCIAAIGVFITYNAYPQVG